MEKTYQPQAIEQYWYQRWEQAGDFQPSGQGQPYCIMLPPPNVTGSLHMGHGFQHTLMDALIRYHRMCGFNTLWQGGVDHAGIATQIVVERQLEAENLSRHDIGREAFAQKVWQWKAQSGNRISEQLRRMGSSIDWSRARFTMDEGFAHAVQHAFIQLYQEGLIYRGKRLVNWDPKLQSAVSDLEVVFKEEAGHLWHIRYPLVNQPDKYIVVATTRPETLFGDVAVAVHPDDARYQSLIGQQLKLPLTNRTIPVIADEYVDPAFGSGCVKITPAHDFNDYAVGQRHHLPLINILTAVACLNEQVPKDYQGLPRQIARKKVIDDLEKAGLIDHIEKYTVNTPYCERTGEIIEPYLTDQWYVHMQPLAERAIIVVEKNELRFIPENWTKTYLQWLHNIQDWCISRQLWWGHRIPAWYDAQGNVYVGESESTVRKTHKLADDVLLHQDEDVLDTWFSAALWPFATLGWPEKTSDFITFYPTNVLVTGFDIIFFWVARMVMFGLHFTGKVPFKEVYVHGLIRDQHGQKMSKSKGNVLDPIDLIDGIDLESLIQKRTYGLLQPAMAKSIAENTRQQFPEGIPAYGTDALRFTYCALATTGRDIRFDLGRISGYRNFCNKLWNAARYVLMNTTETIPLPLAGEDVRRTGEGIANLWILSRLQRVTTQAHEYFAQYRFDLLAQMLYEFVWQDYCDWYLELAKVTLNQTDAGQQQATRYTLLHVLENTLRLLHPLIPFITEEIWQRIAPLLQRKARTIQLQRYPVAEEKYLDVNAENKITWLQQITMAIRNIRSEMQIPPGKKLNVLLQNGDTHDEQNLAELRPFICSLARLSKIDWITETPPPSATAVVGKLQLFIPLQDFIDKDAEIARLRKEIEKLSVELTKSAQKLSNPSYVDKAPAAVVEKERALVAERTAAIEKLQRQLGEMQLIGLSNN